VPIGGDVGTVLDPSVPRTRRVTGRDSASALERSIWSTAWSGSTRTAIRPGVVLGIVTPLGKTLGRWTVWSTGWVSPLAGVGRMVSPRKPALPSDPPLPVSRYITSMAGASTWPRFWNVALTWKL